MPLRRCRPCQPQPTTPTNNARTQPLPGHPRPYVLLLSVCVCIGTYVRRCIHARMHPPCASCPSCKWFRNLNNARESKNNPPTIQDQPAATERRLHTCINRQFSVEPPLADEGAERETRWEREYNYRADSRVLQIERTGHRSKSLSLSSRRIFLLQMLPRLTSVSTNTAWAVLSLSPSLFGGAVVADLPGSLSVFLPPPGIFPALLSRWIETEELHHHCRKETRSARHSPPTQPGVLVAALGWCDAPRSGGCVMRTESSDFKNDMGGGNEEGSR